MNTKELTAGMKKRPFTAICGVLALVLAGTYFFRHGSIAESEAVLEQKTTENRRLKGNVANSAQLKDQVDALEDASAKIAQRLMRAADLAKNQQYFYKIESETGVKLADLRPGATAAPAAGKAAPKTLYSSVPYTCTVRGTYPQLLDFLRKLERGEHFQRIKTATISLGGGTGEDDASSADPTLSLIIAVEFLGQS